MCVMFVVLRQKTAYMVRISDWLSDVCSSDLIPSSAGFEPEEFLDLCDLHPGASCFLAPTMVQRLVATGRPRPANLTTVVYGGGPMYVDSLKKAMAARPETQREGKRGDRAVRMWGCRYL